MHDDEESPKDPNPGKDWKNLASSDELNDSEQSFYKANGSGKAGSNNSLSKGGLYKAEGKAASAALSAAAAVNPYAKAAQFVLKHKKGGAALGGGITTFIILFVALFGIIAAHELQTVEQDLLKYEDKATSYVIKKAANKILQKIACRTSVSPASISGCKSSNSSEGDDNPTEQTAEDGDPMTAEIDKVNLADPNIEEGLSNEGITVNTQDGKFSSLTNDETNSPISESDFDDANMVDAMQTGIPVFDVGIRETDEPLMINHEGASFDVFQNPDEEADKTVEETEFGTEPGAEQQLADASAEDENKPPSSNASAAEKAQAALDQSVSDQSNAMLEEVDKGVEAGDSEYQIEQNLESSDEGAGSQAFIITSLSDACSVEKDASLLAKARIPMIMGFLVRHITTLSSVADEEHVGGNAETGAQISGTTKLLNGNSSAPAGSTAAMTGFQSAAWQRATGDPVTSSNPDMPDDVKPTENSATKTIDDISSIMSHTGLNLGCSLATNSFFQAIMGVTQLGLDVVSGGTLAAVGQLVDSASIGVVNGVVLNQIIPIVVREFTPIGVDGLEDSVQWMNNADAGGNIMFNMFSQRMGGEPLTSGQATALNTQGSNLQQIAENKESFLNRTFSFSNPDSLVAHLSVEMPTSPLTALDAFLGDIIKAPELLFHAFASLVEGAKVYAATQDADPGSPYGLTQYGFDPNKINEYDPINNEYHLFHTTVSAPNGSSALLINLLGNPNDYPNASDDNSTVDILHCFTQSSNNSSLPGGAPADWTSPNSICGTEGSYDYATLTPSSNNTITPSNVAHSFCIQLDPGDPTCQSYMLSQTAVQTAMDHFRQYLLDDEITGWYASLGNNQ